MEKVKVKRVPWWIKQGKPNPLLTKVPWWVKNNAPNPALTANLGNKHSEESRKKMSISSKRAYKNGKVSMHGKKHSPETIEKMKRNAHDTSDEKNPMWKGDDVGYSALHIWVGRKLGKPCKCSECGESDTDSNYEWSNISRKYKRDLKDWRALCISCHRKYDYEQKGGVTNGK